MRPGLIVGPDDPTDRFTYWPVRLARGGEVLAPGDGRRPVQFIDVRDLADWIDLSVVEKHVLGTFNATRARGDAHVGQLLDACNRRRGNSRRSPGSTPSSSSNRRSRRGATCRCGSRPSANATIGAASTARAPAAGLTFRPIADTARDTLAWWNGLPEARRAKLRAGLPPTARRRARRLAQAERLRRRCDTKK